LRFSLIEASVTPRVEAHLRDDDPPSHERLAKVSLWLGHSSVQTTEIYTRADPSVKLETLEAAISPKLRTGRFKATDKLIALLKTSTIMRSAGAIP
jgi:hypothetical protein